MSVDSYVIRARIVAEDATAPGARSAVRRIKDVEREAESASSKIGGLFGRAFALIGGAAVFGGAVRGIVGLNAEAQNARFTLASLFSANTGDTMTASLRIAKGELGTLREMAAVGAGELSDYSGAFGTLFLPLRNAGADLDRINKLIGQTVAIGALEGRGSEGMALAAFDVQQAMTVGLGQRTTPIINKVIAGIGETTESFNALSKEARMAVLETAFKRYDGAITAMGATWEARMSTFRDNIKGIARTLTEPLFERWSTGLSNANAYLAKNKDQLKEIAEKWGSRLVRVWDHLVERAGTYAAIVAATGALLVAPSIAGSVKGTRGAIGTTVSNAYQNARFLSANAGGGAAAFAAGGKGFLSVIGQALSKIAIPIAIVTTAIFALKGGLEEYPGVLLFIKDQAKALMDTFGTLSDSFALVTGHASALNMVGAVLGGVFGALLWVVDKVVIGIGLLVAGFSAFLGVLGGTLKALFGFLTGDSGLGKRGLTEAQRSVESSGQTISDLLFGKNNNGIFGEQTGPNGETLGANGMPVNKGGDTNVNIANMKVEVKAEANADPARVAVAFGEVLNHVTKYRTQGKRIPGMAG